MDYKEVNKKFKNVTNYFQSQEEWEKFIEKFGDESEALDAVRQLDEVIIGMSREFKNKDKKEDAIVETTKEEEETVENLLKYFES